MPAGFELFQPADVYVPFGPWAATLPDDRGWHPGIFPVARLRDDVSIERARMEMDTIAQQLEAEHRDSNTNVRALVTRAQDQLVQNVRPALLMLVGAVALVLLIACANVANLLLARASDRQKEMAVRLALGASRARIIRQLMVESFVLSGLGGTAGLVITWFGVSLLNADTIAGLPRAQNIAVAWPVALFALTIAVLTGVTFGLAPARQAMNVDLRTSLNEETRGGSASLRHRRTREMLVVAEIALALMLLVGASLLVRSYAALTRVVTGFETGNLLLVNLPLSPRTYRDNVSRTAVVDRIVTDVRAVPGVRAAAVTTMPPMAGAGSIIHFNRTALRRKVPTTTSWRAIARRARNRSTLGVPLRRGRMLDARDHEQAPRVVVINQSMARQFFPGLIRAWPRRRSPATSRRRSRAGRCSGVTVIHRYGRIAPGENIVLVVTASSHREAAFAAAEFLMDYLKTQAPFWKQVESRGGQNLGRGQGRRRCRGGALAKAEPDRK